MCDVEKQAVERDTDPCAKGKDPNAGEGGEGFNHGLCHGLWGFTVESSGRGRLAEYRCRGRKARQGLEE